MPIRRGGSGGQTSGGTVPNNTLIGSPSYANGTFSFPRRSGSPFPVDVGALEELSPWTSGGAVTAGTVQIYSNSLYLCVNAITAASPASLATPDTSSDWVFAGAWAGTWSSVTYTPGHIVEDDGGYYLSVAMTDNVAPSAGGTGWIRLGAPTNIGVNERSDGVRINSSTGSNATIDAATTNLAGVMLPADRTHLNTVPPVWAAGDHEVGEQVSWAQKVYRCIVARSGSDTDNPATDTVGWKETGSGTGGVAFIRSAADVNEGVRVYSERADFTWLLLTLAASAAVYPVLRIAGETSSNYLDVELPHEFVQHSNVDHGNTIELAYHLGESSHTRAAVAARADLPISGSAAGIRLTHNTPGEAGNDFVLTFDDVYNSTNTFEYTSDTAGTLTLSRNFTVQNVINVINAARRNGNQIITASLWNSQGSDLADWGSDHTLNFSHGADAYTTSREPLLFEIVDTDTFRLTLIGTDTLNDVKALLEAWHYNGHEPFDESVTLTGDGTDTVDADLLPDNVGDADITRMWSGGVNPGNQTPVVDADAKTVTIRYGPNHTLRDLVNGSTDEVTVSLVPGTADLQSPEEVGAEIPFDFDHSGTEGEGGSVTEDEVYEHLKNILEGSGNVTVTPDDDTDRIEIGHAGAGSTNADGKELTRLARITGQSFADNDFSDHDLSWNAATGGVATSWDEFIIVVQDGLNKFFFRLDKPDELATSDQHYIQSPDMHYVERARITYTAGQPRVVTFGMDMVSGRGLSNATVTLWGVEYHGVKGDTGDQGLRGTRTVPLYANSASTLSARPQVEYTPSTDSFTVVSSGWSDEPSTPATGERTWVSIFTLTPGTSSTASMISGTVPSLWTSSVNVFTGTAVPPNTLGVAGDLYLRQVGTTSIGIYTRDATEWTLRFSLPGADTTIYRGTWSSGGDYPIGSIVLYSGAFYITSAPKSSSDTTAPDSDNDWDQIDAAGGGGTYDDSSIDARLDTLDEIFDRDSWQDLQSNEHAGVQLMTAAEFIGDLSGFTFAVTDSVDADSLLAVIMLREGLDVNLFRINLTGTDNDRAIAGSTWTDVTNLVSTEPDGFNVYRAAAGVNRQTAGTPSVATLQLRDFPASGGGNTLTDAEIGDKAFSNPPTDLSDDEKTAARDAIGAGDGTVSDDSIGSDELEDDIVDRLLPSGGTNGQFVSTDGTVSIWVDVTPDGTVIAPQTITGRVTLDQSGSTPEAEHVYPWLRTSGLADGTRPISTATGTDGATADRVPLLSLGAGTMLSGLDTTNDEVTIAAGIYDMELEVANIWVGRSRHATARIIVEAVLEQEISADTWEIIAVSESPYVRSAPRVSPSGGSYANPTVNYPGHSGYDGTTWSPVRTLLHFGNVYFANDATIRFRMIRGKEMAPYSQTAADDAFDPGSSDATNGQYEPQDFMCDVPEIRVIHTGVTTTTGGDGETTDITHLEHQVDALQDVTLDLHAGTPPKGWADVTNPGTEGGVAIFSSDPSLATLRGVAEADWLGEITSGVANQHFAVRLPTATEVQQGQVLLTSTVGSLVYTLPVHALQHVGASADDAWQYYREDSQLGNVSSIKLQLTGNAAHVGTTRYTGELPGVEEWGKTENRVNLRHFDSDQDDGSMPNNDVTVATVQKGISYAVEVPQIARNDYRYFEVIDSLSIVSLIGSGGEAIGAATEQMGTGVKRYRIGPVNNAGRRASTFSVTVR